MPIPTRTPYKSSVWNIILTENYYKLELLFIVYTQREGAHKYSLRSFTFRLHGGTGGAVASSFLAGGLLVEHAHLSRVTRSLFRLAAPICQHATFNNIY